MITKPVIDVGLKITLVGRVLFAVRRLYNRTVGVHVLNWSGDRLTLFGYNIVSKRSVDALYSKQARENLRVGLSADEYREVCQALAITSFLPTPELLGGAFSDRQQAEYGIRLICNRFYVCST